MAAVLATGNTAMLSHRSAAALWGLRADSRARADVSLPSQSGRSRPGITVHTSTTMRAQDMTVHEGIPCTSVARTLLDLAEGLNPRQLERAVEEAEAALEALEEELADPAAWADAERSAASSARHTEAKHAVEELYARWEHAGG